MNLTQNCVIKIHRVSQHVYNKQTPWFKSTLEIILSTFISASRKRRKSGGNCCCNANHNTWKFIPSICPRSLHAKFCSINGTCMYRTCSSTIEARVRRSFDGVSRLNDDVTRRMPWQRCLTLPTLAVSPPPIGAPACLTKNTKRRRK